MAAIKSFGVTVSVATNPIGGLREANIPEVDVTDIDVTTHSSPLGFKEYVDSRTAGSSRFPESMIRTTSASNTSPTKTTRAATRWRLL